MKDYLEITVENIDHFETKMIKSKKYEPFSIDWGDGEIEHYDNKKLGSIIAIGHYYKQRGTYTIRFNIGNVTLASGDTYDNNGAPFMDLTVKSIIKVSGSLPATRLAPWCYVSMFGWNRIEDISDFVLPATNLREYCYDSMFINNNIKSLKGFSLPATKLVPNCYKSMFKTNEIKNLDGLHISDKGLLTNNEYAKDMFKDNPIKLINERNTIHNIISYSEFLKRV